MAYAAILRQLKRGRAMTDHRELDNLPLLGIEARGLAPVHRTAIRAARLRALHLLVDGDPKVFVDDWALTFTGDDPAALRACAPTVPWPTSAWVVRSRYTEDLLHLAIAAGVQQYVILGAGLDSYAYRHAETLGALRVYEVDDPTLQRWKRERLTALGVVSPPQCRYVPCNFTTRALPEALAAADFRVDAPAFVSWLAVTQYLSHTAIAQTLRWFGGLAPGSQIVLTYFLPEGPEDGLSPRQRALLHELRASGVPFDTFFTPDAMERTLRAAGLTSVEHLTPAEADARYFAGRTDGLCSWAAERLVSAKVAAP
jgi:methyltransferase (TIGR00027 family)